MNDTVYLVTGAAGNLGGSVSRQLVARGKRVRALVLKGDPAAARVPPEAEVVFGDVTDPDSLEAFFAGAAGADLAVIHCASVVTVSPDYSRKVYDVNVTGTLNIVEKCLEHRAKKLVYVSSTSAIPEPSKGTPITEVSAFDPDAVVGYYGKTKAEASQIVMDAARSRGLDASIVFPSGIGGPGDYAYGPFASFIVDYANGKMPGGVDGSFNAVDVRDLASGVIACCERGRKGEGYIMGNACVSMREMFRLIGEINGTKEARVILPIPVANALAAVSGLVGKVTGKPPRLTTFAVYNLARNNDFRFEKAERELGYRVRPFRETMADTIAWLKAEGKIA